MLKNILKKITTSCENIESIIGPFCAGDCQLITHASKYAYNIYLEDKENKINIKKKKSYICTASIQHIATHSFLQ